MGFCEGVLVKKVTVGLCGLGTVGSGVFNVMARNAELINARAGCEVSIIHIGARRDREGCDTSGVKVNRDIFAVLDDPAVDIVVELIGGTDTARDLVLAAISKGKHVVTANKALIAHHGAEIFAAAAEKKVAVAYEAAVAGGIPIIKALRDGIGCTNDLCLGVVVGTATVGCYHLPQDNLCGNAVGTATTPAFICVTATHVCQRACASCRCRPTARSSTPASRPGT